MKMTIPQHPFRAHWQPIEIETFGYRFADTIEAAALEAITTFCEQHPNEVAEYPIGLFPAADYHDPEWSFRVEHCAHLLGDFSRRYGVYDGQVYERLATPSGVTAPWHYPLG